MVIEKEEKSTYVDVGVKGESVGDYVLVRSALLDETGRKVGRLLVRCMLQFKPDVQCDGAYKLRGRGDIMFANVVDTADEPPVVGPIVGGDGDFADVGGQLTLEYQGRKAHTTLEIHHHE